MAYTTVDNGEEYFNTVLWTGDASSDKSISGVGFQPDWVWAKNRSDSNDHQTIDSNRGAGKILRPNGNGAELTRSSDVGAGGLQNFESDGFDVHSTTSNTNLNDNGELNVGWCWKANGGTTSSNSDGSVTSTVQANTDAGFSIVTYTGTGSGNTIGHGLGTTPGWIIAKVRSTTNNWGVWHQDLGGANKYLKLNTTDSTITATDVWNNTLPTSTVFSTGAAGTTNDSGATYVAYCFAEKKGYSKFGKFRGNANADGPFIYTGFKPSWLMIKNIGASGTGYHWYIWDNKRDNINVMDNTIHGDESNAENTFDQDIDFLSNGFKLRGSGVGMNPNSHDAIYFAFAEHPFVSSKGVPVTAR